MTCTQGRLDYDWIYSLKILAHFIRSKVLEDFLHYVTQINCLTGAIISETYIRHILRINIFNDNTILHNIFEVKLISSKFLKIILPSYQSINHHHIPSYHRHQQSHLCLQQSHLWQPTHHCNQKSAPTIIKPTPLSAKPPPAFASTTAAIYDSHRRHQYFGSIFIWYGSMGLMTKNSVADPDPLDPHVVGPPGSGSIS